MRKVRFQHIPVVDIPVKDGTLTKYSGEPEYTKD